MNITGLTLIHPGDLELIQNWVEFKQSNSLFYERVVDSSYEDFVICSVVKKTDKYYIIFDDINVESIILSKICKYADCIRFDNALDAMYFADKLLLQYFNISKLYRDNLISVNLPDQMVLIGVRMSKSICS